MTDDLPPEQVDETPEQAEQAGGVPPGAENVEPNEDLVDDQADLAEDFLNGLLELLGIDGEAEASIDEDDLITVDIEGEDLALLIGKHGATLQALQELTRAMVQQQSDARTSLVVDVGGYRERQREILERKARTAAATVRKTGQAQSLEPMSAYDRRIVHNALVDFEGVSTTSEGLDPERYVVILPAPRA